jgi:membrane protease YdiL (CAAX protease family)
MTEPSENGPTDSGEPSPTPELPAPAMPEMLPPSAIPRRRFYPVALVLALGAWCIIAFWVAFSLVSHAVGQSGPGDAGAQDNLNLLVMRYQARVLIGLRELWGGALGGDQKIYADAKSLNAGPISQRLRFVVLAGELQGPAEALKVLDLFDDLIEQKEAQLTPRQDSLRDILGRLYADYQRHRYDAPSLTDEDRLHLRANLGWFGDLALAPAGDPDVPEQFVALAGAPAAATLRDACPDPKGREQALQSAKRAAVAFLAMIATATGFLFLGFCGLLIVSVLFLLHVLQGGLECGTSPAGVYVETFALWVLLFFGTSLGLRGLEMGQFHLLWSGLAELGTLAALAWPVARGVPWRTVREDVGLTLGRRPSAEPAIGLGCYLMGYPLMLVGFLITLALMAVQQMLNGHSPDDLVSPSVPSHPIEMPLASGDWELRLQIFFLASIVAPIVEETMFRGVLYRHLRELTCRGFTAISIIFSGLVSSFIFAVIHPQGLLAVPMLMALACGFVLAREWRATLVPCMVAHGVHNGLTLLLAIAMLGD